MSKWDDPQVISDVMFAFPADVTGLLPAENEIPEEYWDANNKWHRLAGEIMFDRLSDATITEREDLDRDTTVRHIFAVLRSFQPKHEHKIAGTAFLLSRFYKDIEFLE